MKTNNTHLIHNPIEPLSSAQPQNSAPSSKPLALKLEHLQAAASVAVLGGGVTGAYFVLNGGFHSATPAIPTDIDQEEIVQQYLISDSISTEEVTVEETMTMDEEYIAMAETLLESNQGSNELNEQGEISFGVAFRNAREELGSGASFVWQGDTFSTFFEEEWDQMSSDQKGDYLNSVYQSEDFESTGKYELFAEIETQNLHSEQDEIVPLDQSYLSTVENETVALQEDHAGLSLENHPESELEIEFDSEDDFEVLIEDF